MVLYSVKKKHKKEDFLKLPKIAGEKRGIGMKAKQLKALEMLVKGDYDTYEEAADKLKISPKTLYNWRQDEEFSKEYDKRIRIKLGGMAARAAKRIDELIDSENPDVAFRASKDVLDRTGYKTADKLDISAETTGQISVAFEGELDDWSE